MYEQTYTIKEEHIDFQGILDGLYYPFYMEWCRHNYIKEILGFDLVQQSQAGVNMVLAEYHFKFKSSLKKDDRITVTCHVEAIEGSRSKFGFKQQILCEGKVSAEANFVATCVPTNGGRPFIPESVQKFILNSSAGN